MDFKQVTISYKTNGTDVVLTLDQYYQSISCIINILFTQKYAVDEHNDFVVIAVYIESFITS